MSASAPRSTPRPPNGFSLVELLLVAVILGILAQLAIPNYKAVRDRARAVEAMADVDVIEQAARDFQADNLRWPDDVGPGSIPPGLQPHLPGDFDFEGENYLLDWERYETPGGLPGDPAVRRILGVGIVTSDEGLGRALTDVFGERGWFAVGPSYIWIIERE